MQSHGIEVDILVNGKPVRQYTHEGRVFIEARNFTEYSIRIKNNNYYRRLAIVSVDGINVIDGQAAGSTQAGYVIQGYNSCEIKGFRTSNEAVHPFKFSKKEDSYAAKSDVTQGDTTNCGVIGVEIKSEKAKPVTRPIKKSLVEYIPVPYPVPTPTPAYPWYGAPYFSSQGGKAATTNSNDCLTSSLVGQLRCYSEHNELVETSYKSMLDTPRGFDTGTEFSDKAVTDTVHEVEFDIGYSICTMSIYYASRDSLEEMGVPLKKETCVTFPDPFPSKFCKPPKR